jgi:regulator of protease activity HflC (stomatin/prohibitin superfamily)
MQFVTQFLLSPWVIMSTVTVALIGAALHVCVLVVQEGEVVIVERLGKFAAIKHAGWHWLVPFVDSTRYAHWTRRIEKKQAGGRVEVVSDVYRSDRISVATVVFDIPPVQCFTREHIQVGVNIVVYHRVVDARKALYGVQDLYAAVELKVETLLHGLVRDMSIEDLTTHSLQVLLATRLQSEQWPSEWGLHIDRFEIQSVELPLALRSATLDTVVARRQADAEHATAEATRRKQLGELETEALVARKRAEGEMATLNHRLASQRLENECANEKARAHAETEAYNTRTQDEVVSARYEAKYAAMKKSGLSEQYFIAQQQSKATREVMRAGLQGSNKTLVIPYEALTQNALITARYLAPEQPILASYNAGGK